MVLTELFGKKAVSTSSIFELGIEMHPLKLNAHAKDYVEMNVTLTNHFDKELLTSLVVAAPKALSFDQTGFTHQREVRFGMVPPKETKTAKIQVYATQRTPKGVYTINVFAISHYRNYSYLMNEIRKQVELRVE